MRRISNRLMFRYWLYQALRRSVLAILLVSSGSILADEDVGSPIGENGQPIVVEGTIGILDVDSISDTDQNFTINLYGEFRWKDPSQAHNALAELSKPLGDIWNPRITLLNAQRTWSSYPESVDITPNGEVVYRFRVWGDFSQALQLRDFPFDTQRFEVQVVAADYEPDEVVLTISEEEKSFLTENYSVPNWRIENWSIETRMIRFEDGSVQQGLVFGFEGKRRYGQYFIKVIIPLILIVIMSWIVFWLDPREAGTQLSVSVTAMLTVMAYHIAVSSNLPDIPYVTRLDLFLLGTTLLVFASIFEVVVTSNLAHDNQIDRALGIDKLARRLFPLMFGLITLYALVV